MTASTSNRYRKKARRRSKSGGSGRSANSKEKAVSVKTDRSSRGRRGVSRRETSVTPSRISPEKKRDRSPLSSLHHGPMGSCRIGPGVIEWDWTLVHCGRPRPWTRPRARGKVHFTIWSPFHEQLFAASRSAAPVEPINDPLSLELVFYFKRPKRQKPKTDIHSKTPDIDNLIKGVGDILQKAKVIEDDKLISDVRALKRYSDDFEGVMIYLKRFSDDQG